ncbi:MULTISPECIES: DNA-binding protein [Trichocoleus]|uniref:DNA-binding protein n=1 Tax=Trichocoleus desertorum GB2-A4 TaxID=2933944 RepID=A0ABV0J323_9CYAN|nr:DNA-binding protein [Trichocoleus sp. FACHB-46]MBD1860785.1 DNA-binding protein [Trichocoleus sp. FACHB-46]
MAGAKEKIYGAALMILSENKRPTVDLVQKATKCSFTTVTKYMKEFREDYKEEIARAENRREPLPEPIREMAENLWNVALLVAENRFNDDRVRSQDEALDKQGKELEEAMLLITDLKARLEERDKKYEQLKAAFLEAVKEKPNIQSIVSHLAPNP